MSVQECMGIYINNVYLHICVYIDTECMCLWVNTSVKPLLMAVQNKKRTLNDQGIRRDRSHFPYLFIHVFYDLESGEKALC